ncbi:MAG: glutamate synthase subunit alpha, partial [Chloroflexia bacterium]|nr:glutamate synthase subunit alpha [Chloroflexia bacterium]
ADTILISGHSGGTGASPLSSIKNAGLPWELGLAETQQTLVLNGLRGRVRLRADGGLKTGRDVVIAAMLGADEFSFGTAALVAEGCIMARACHNNTCPVGIATQRAELRSKFPGKPEMVMAFFRYLAQEVREWLASLGLRSLDEVIGRSDLLRQRQVGHAGPDSLDLTPVIGTVHIVPGAELRHGGERNPLPVIESLNDRIMHDTRAALAARGPVTLTYEVHSRDRSVGTRLAGAIGQIYGDKGLPPSTIRINLRGSAGQSFGAFATAGIELTIEGDANDYLGKGLCGARIIVKAPQDAGWSDKDNLLAGNVALFGATGGELYLAGRAGERFCVRNSGAIAVCEGVGDHGCEYMTGGTAVILGSVGHNFASGMSGGIAYVLDDGNFRRMVNKNMVALYELDALDLVLLYRYLTNHVNYT